MREKTNTLSAPGWILIAPGEVYRKVLRIILPVCFQQLLNQGANFVDTMMVSYIGYVSAVAVAGEVNNLMLLVGFGINSGLSVYAAQFYGIRDWKNLRRCFGLYVVLNFFTALAFFSLAMIGQTRLLSFYSADAVLVAQAWEYLSVFAVSFFFAAISNGFSFMYRCVQNPKVPMIIGIGVNLGNALLNYLLIFGKLGLPAMGARGAALASVIATGLGLVVHIVYAVVSRQPFLGSFREIVDWPLTFWQPMVRRIAPLVVNELIFGLGDTMYMKAFNLLGTKALESYKVAFSISMVPYTVTAGVGSACSVVVGECLGRKEKEEAKNTVRWLLPISAVTAVAVTGLMFLMARPAVGLFSLSSPDLVPGTIIMVKLGALRIALRLFNVIFLYSIRAGGDSLYIMFLDCGLVWLVGIPVAFGSILLCGVSSMPLLFLIVQGEQFVRLALAIRRYRTGKWLNNLTDEVQE